jgi:hypothetical protein
MLKSTSSTATCNPPTITTTTTLQDIMNAMEQEEQELLQRCSHTGELKQITSALVQHQHAAPAAVAAAVAPTNGGPQGPSGQQQPQQRGLQASAEPTAAGVAGSSPAGSHGPPRPAPVQIMFGVPPSPHASTPSESGGTPQTGPSATSGGPSGGFTGLAMQRLASFTGVAGSPVNSPRLTGLAAAVPLTPKLRFGIDVLQHPPLQQQQQGGPSTAGSAPPGLPLGSPSGSGGFGNRVSSFTSGGGEGSRSILSRGNNVPSAPAGLVSSSRPTSATQVGGASGRLSGRTSPSTGPGSTAAVQGGAGNSTPAYDRPPSVTDLLPTSNSQTDIMEASAGSAIGATIPAIASQALALPHPPAGLAHSSSRSWSGSGAGNQAVHPPASAATKSVGPGGVVYVAGRRRSIGGAEEVHAEASTSSVGAAAARAASSNLEGSGDMVTPPPPLVRDSSPVHTPPHSPTLTASGRVRSRGAAGAGAGGTTPITGTRASPTVTVSHVAPLPLLPDPNHLHEQYTEISPRDGSRVSGGSSIGRPGSGSLTRRHSLTSPLGRPPSERGTPHDYTPNLHHPTPSSGGGAKGAGAEGLTASTEQLHAVSAAVEALSAASGMAASKEALQLKAAMMFNRSVELQTGGIQWTRGELLGRWYSSRCHIYLNSIALGYGADEYDASHLGSTWAGGCSSLLLCGTDGTMCTRT